jgi:pyruvate-ferredoxin/flavodoxin oxidoreductase
VNPEGRGPAWSNSLFEDNAEFGLGFRLSIDNLRGRPAAYCRAAWPERSAMTWCERSSEPIKPASRHLRPAARVAALREKLQGHRLARARRLALLADYLVKKSVWLVGGDGWAYDIGFGGLDHVLSMTRKVNVLVLDTEVYSNTGGQSSKSTPLAAPPPSSPRRARPSTRRIWG